MDRTIAAVVALSDAVLTLSGCSHTGKTLSANSEDEPMKFAVQAQPTPNTMQESNVPVIGHLKTRDKLITIRTGSDGPLYTVKSKDGTVLAVNLPAEDLYAMFPELKDLMERGIADWAGLDPKFRTIDSPIVHVPAPTYETKTIIIEHNNDLQLTK